MIVMKFGGTSVGTAETLRTAASVVANQIDRQPLVVVSAHNSPQCRMTNTLIEAADKALAGDPRPEMVAEPQLKLCAQLGVAAALVQPLLDELSRLLTGISMIQEISPRTLDQVMSFGERLSHIVLADVLRREFDVRADAVAAYDLGLRSDAVFGEATPDPDSYPAVMKAVTERDCDVIITTGFLAKGPHGHITTLGRGGSDFSATIFGAALQASEVQIWTDVDGVMSVDPKLTPGARSIAELTFMEASELAWYGARILHPATMLPAIEHGIPVRILNTKKPEHPGTLVVAESTSTTHVAKSIVYNRHVNLITITSSRMLGTHGFMAKVFSILGANNVDIHMIATSEVTISLTAPKENDLTQAAAELSAFSQVEVEHDKAMVCIVGENMAGHPGTASRVMHAMAEEKINIRMISQGASELNIALLVDDTEAEKAVIALHRAFFE